MEWTGDYRAVMMPVRGGRQTGTGSITAEAVSFKLVGQQLVMDEG